MTDPRKRLLFTREYLLENTDERHAASVPELVAFLERKGLDTDRRAVVADIAALCQTGFCVKRRNTRPRAYFFDARAFQPAETQFLIDMVYSNKTLSHERSEALAEKIAGLVSRFDAADLRRGTVRRFREKPAGGDALCNMERIHESFCRGRKLSFFYGQYTLDKTPVFRRGAERCAVSPCATVYADGNYYLLADHPKREGYARYRVDKMTDARVLDDACAPPDPAFDPSQLADDAFSTRPEKSRWVSLAFQEEFVGEMIDRFGAGAPMVKIDERTWSVCAPVCVAPSFFGWVFQFGGGVRILAPDDVREEMALLVEAARAALNR